MSVTTLSGAANSVSQQLNCSYASVIDSSEAVADHIADEISSWKDNAQKKLQLEFPLQKHGQHLETGWNKFDQHRASPEKLRKLYGQLFAQYYAFSKEAQHPFNGSFWLKQLEPEEKSPGSEPTASHTDIKVSTRLLLSDWQKAFDQRRGEWELAEIESLRAKLLKQLEQLLQLLAQLKEQLEALGLDPGILLDLSKGQLTRQDIEQFRRWADYLANDHGVQKLCDVLGKIRQIELSERVERVKVNTPIEAHLPDINSREEVVGIRLGRDLEHALPSELALLSEPETSLLFDLKFVESRLMCFDMQGLQKAQEHAELEQEEQIQEANKQGPMVICVDTSGSMSGMPETIAKAVTLYMASKAREQKRPCYLVNFSTGITTLDLSGQSGMEPLLGFLQQSFHGGTDAAPASEHALQVMQKDEYKNADLLMLSDFIMSGLPASLLQGIEAQRVHGNRFYSLVIGSSYMTERLKTLFDHEWIYDPHRSQIHELVSFQERVTTQAEHRV